MTSFFMGNVYFILAWVTFVGLIAFAIYEISARVLDWRHRKKRQSAEKE